MPVIPNKMHFIWVGTNLPERHAKTLLNWVLENPLYEFYLWGEARQIGWHVSAMMEAVQDEVRTGTIERMQVFDDPAGERMVFFKNDEQIGQLLVTSVGLLEPLFGSEVIYAEELRDVRNYGAASDILRLWALYQHGGIYSDFDVFPTGPPIRIDVPAPNEMLFATSPQNDTELLNSFIAAVQGTHKIRDIIEMQVAAYREELEETEEHDMPFWKYTDSWNSYVRSINRFREMREAGRQTGRVNLEQTGDFQVRASMTLKTIHRTGPLRIWEWFKRKEKMRIFTEDVYAYSFQKQSGYHPRITSEESWIT